MRRWRISEQHQKKEQVRIRITTEHGRKGMYRAQYTSVTCAKRLGLSAKKRLPTSLVPALSFDPESHDESPH